MTSTGLPSFRLHGAFVAALSLLLMHAWGPDVRAQAGPSLRSTERPIEVVLDPTYQSYESETGRVLNQASTYLAASVPVTQRFTVETRLGYAQMGAGDLPKIRGLTDASGRLLYAQPVGDGSVVFSTRVNIPVGKQELSPDAVRVTRAISQNFYDFRVSSYSRGFKVAPQVTWAYPLTDRLAVGIGAGYQYQRGFRPRAGMDESYVPGDGIGANGGIDYKLTQTSALGADIAFRRYAPDRVGGARRFDAGTRVSGTVRYLLRSGFTTVRAVARYANWEESEFGYRVGTPERGQVIPSHAMILGSYRTRFSDGLYLTVRASGHRYAETVRAGRKTFGRLNLIPSFEVADGIALAPHGTVTYGSFSGIGGGLRIQGEF